MSRLKDVFQPLLAVKTGRALFSVKFVVSSRDEGCLVDEIVGLDRPFGCKPSSSSSEANRSLVTVSMSSSPVGCFVSLNTAHAQGDDELMQSLVGLAVEPGTLVWFCSPQPHRTHLLNQLAAVASMATFVSCTTAEAARRVLPNYIVIAPLGWPVDAPKRAEQDLRDWLFKLEPTFSGSDGSERGPSLTDNDAAERNSLRLTIESAFLGVDIFPFPERVAASAALNQPYGDRVSQFYRSKYVSGCIEGWSVASAGKAIPTTTGTTHSISPFEMVLDRIARSVNLFQEPIIDSAASAEWVTKTLQQMVETEFDGPCKARASRITAEAARSLHNNVQSRCERVIHLALPSEHVSHTLHSQVTLLENRLQDVLLAIQKRDETKRLLQAEQQRTSLLPQNGFQVDSSHASLWFGVVVTRFVPRAYWFWFTNQGMGVAFVFVTLLLYTFWPRGG